MLTKREEYRPGKSGYVSEFTLFMENLLEWHPEIVKDQHVGWAIFWDKHADTKEPKKDQTDSVPLKASGND